MTQVNKVTSVMIGRTPVFRCHKFEGFFSAIDGMSPEDRAEVLSVEKPILLDVVGTIQVARQEGCGSKESIVTYIKARLQKMFENCKHFCKLVTERFLLELSIICIEYNIRLQQGRRPTLA